MRKAYKAQHNTGVKRNAAKYFKLTAKLVSLAVASLFLPVSGNVSAAPFDIAQVPLGFSSETAPNVMYIYDDSSSMGYGFLPEDILTYDTYSAFYSSAWNKQYYNPNVLYLPPKDYNGVDMDQPGAKPKQLVTTFTSALIDPFLKPNPDIATNRKDLSTKYQPLFYSNPKDPIDGKQMSQAPYSALKIAGAGTTYGDAQKAFYYVNTGKCAVTGSSPPANSCFTKVIVSATSGTGPAGKDERQNFANWYSFYRVHGLAASTSMSRAFAELGGDFRVGYASLVEERRTIDGVSTDTNVISGVRPFRNFPANDPNYPGKNFREEFYDWIFHLAMTTGTPLRRALNGVGQYYERSDAKGPYAEFPGVGGKELSCRKNITILMTDGYGTDYDTIKLNVGNADGTKAAAIEGPNGQKYTYLPQDPFQDALDSTLADVAMYYWNRDLRKNMDNDVVPNAKDPAFWQHMQTYTVGLGVEPKQLVKDAVFAAIETGAKVAWPKIGTPSKNDGKIEDLMHAAVNGRGDFFAAQDTEQFAEAMRSMISSIMAAAGSVSRLSASSAKLETSTLLYEMRFDSMDWHGNVFAYGICTPADVGVAGCTAAGVPKSTPAWEASALIGSHSSRNILTWNPDAKYGIEFKWSSLSATQQNSVKRNPALSSMPQLSEGEKIVNYVRGDTSNESGANAYRKRGGNRLGDIFSDPVFFGPSATWGYETAPGVTPAEQSAYTTWKQSAAYAATPGMLYVGANDGMLHAFNALSGKEKAAYVPAAVIPKLWHLADKGYGHEFYADTTPVVQEAFFNGGWKNVLIGTAGAGGNSYYALDVTNPDALNTGKVLWEFKHAELGFNGTGQATVARLKNGDWVAIFGNGYNSQSHRAQLFVVKLSNGALVAAIDTSIGNVETPNGLSTPKVYDHDMDGIADRVYAGDVRGNLWRFDLDSMSASLLLKATGPTGVEQPITARPLTVRYKDSTLPGTMVYVGTGKFFENTDAADTRVQSFYGVLDTSSGSLTRNDLVEQRVASSTSANFAGSARPVAQTTTNQVNYADGQRGFFIDLPEDRERVLVAARFLPRSTTDGTILVASRSMSGDSASCSTQPTTGWQMELNALTGAAPKADSTGMLFPLEFNRAKVGTGTLPVHVGGSEGIGLFGGGAGGGSDCVGEGCTGSDANAKECGGEYYFSIGEQTKGLNSCSSSFKGRIAWREIR
jgi:type IV pilus assembly protein PilY1